MLSLKVICNNAYSNKSQSTIGQAVSALCKINQSERGMCSYLEWQLSTGLTTLREFEQKAKRDFKG